MAVAAAIAARDAVNAYKRKVGNEPDWMPAADLYAHLFDDEWDGECPDDSLTPVEYIVMKAYAPSVLGKDVQDAVWALIESHVGLDGQEAVDWIADECAEPIKILRHLEL